MKYSWRCNTFVINIFLLLPRISWEFNNQILFNFFAGKHYLRHIGSFWGEWMCIFIYRIITFYYFDYIALRLKCLFLLKWKWHIEHFIKRSNHHKRFPLFSSFEHNFFSFTDSHTTTWSRFTLFFFSFKLIFCCCPFHFTVDSSPHLLVFMKNHYHFTFAC
jgi:hypothetical protein